MLDPKIKAEEYMEKHKVGELFQSATRLLLLLKPKDPKAFLIEKLTELKAANRKDNFFTDADVSAVFRMFDVTSTGAINASQCKEALQSFGCSVPSMDSIPNRVDSDAFVAIAKRALEGGA
ncbi:hypothetical protein KFL_000600180 [Klebsormidium nitens]|uniref:EF-hand domain-containing protein n=1 Tax=Klebsormidium nitens TaxID=105231 RepID=A0A1Y1HUP0_KLENI|nr:hypothetical protein KFL_000600180 [Klebsormidium nitens]|eukprot:GAQ80701.1 hypothetical protein KFL_000600180 [Klebsormidium nitens]